MAGGVNVYGYVGNDAGNGMDPDGTTVISVGGSALGIWTPGAVWCDCNVLIDPGTGQVGLECDVGAGPGWAIGGTGPAYGSVGPGVGLAGGHIVPGRSTAPVAGVAVPFGGGAITRDPDTGSWGGGGAPAKLGKGDIGISTPGGGAYGGPQRQWTWGPWDPLGPTKRFLIGLEKRAWRHFNLPGRPE